MRIKVTKDLCEIKENEIWNVGDYNVHTVQVELSPEFNGLVNKVRYFVEDKSYDMLITDNVAQVPYEATVMEGTIKIGVYGYDADTDILVQSTSPVNKYISSGTYTGEADNTEPLTPTDKQQIESAIQQNTDDIIVLQNNKQDVLISGENIKTINNESILGSGNIEIGGGTSNYNALTNKPKINNVELNGNKTLNDLGIQPVGNYALESNMIEAQNEIDHLSKVSNLFEKITATGTNITLNNTSDTMLKIGLNANNLIQDDTPSPENPQNIHVIKGNNVITISNSDNTKIQTYSVNLGDIELCKIGDYKDVPFKNTLNSEYYNSSLELNKWYKLNRITTYQITGNENWSLNYTSTAKGIIRYAIDNMLPLNILNNARITVAMAKYFKGVSSTTTNAETQDTPKYCISGRNIRGLHICVDLSNNSLNTLDNFKTWLTNNSVVVYYVLETPTYTLLNDTLQTQLDNLQYALAYDTQTNISQTNTDLPFIIDAETYVDLTDYVKNTDYASSSKGGVIKTGSLINVNSNGIPYGTVQTFSQYSAGADANFISKGTLENVLRGYGIIE